MVQWWVVKSCHRKYPNLGKLQIPRSRQQLLVYFARSQRAAWWKLGLNSDDAVVLSIITYWQLHFQAQWHEHQEHMTTKPLSDHQHSTSESADIP